jgi:hypothetical protein
LRPISTDFDRFDWLEMGGARETDLRPISTSRDHPHLRASLRAHASSSTSFNLHRQVCPGPTTSIIMGTSFSRLLRLLGQVCPGSTPPSSWVHSSHACFKFLLAFSIKQL